MTMYEMKATNVNTNTKMGVLVKMMLLNDHFHDNDTAYICDDKVFSSVGSLSEYLGGEYMDLGNSCWESVKVIGYDGEIMTGLEMLDRA